MCSVLCSGTSGLIFDRLSDTTKPHLENIRSLATDVAGMAKYALATAATFGKRALLTDHHAVE